jgi:hypothetical protein
MPRTPPIPPELWEQIRPHVRAVLEVVVEGYERRWLWTVVTPQVSLFQVAPSRGAPVLRELLARERALECSTNAGRAVPRFGCVNNRKCLFRSPSPKVCDKTA